VIALVRRHATAVTLAACGLYGIAILLPAMRWGQSEKHAAGGSATIFGDGLALVDFGFGGGEWLPASVLAVGLLAIATIAVQGTRGWWTRLLLLSGAAYCPAWVVHVFLRKAEDEVWPAEGSVLLTLATLFLISTLWLTRPGADDAR
jgi:hypothetical protein